jgi:ataxin-3
MPAAVPLEAAESNAEAMQELEGACSVDTNQVKPLSVYQGTRTKRMLGLVKLVEPARVDALVGSRLQGTGAEEDEDGTRRKRRRSSRSDPGPPAGSVGDMDVEEPGHIYHEKQVGALCGVHCVNNVMQAPLFVHEDFAKVARHLDARERYLLDGDYMASEDGFNHRADGFFNVQVIRAALQDRGFGMEPLTGETMKAALAEPAKQQGFICNKEEHWFALRRIGGEWFDLNSCLNEPRHRTNAQLDATVRQTIKDGYDVFAVTGTYPPLEPSQLQALKEAMQKKDRENPTGKKRKTKAEAAGRIPCHGARQHRSLGELEVCHRGIGPPPGIRLPTDGCNFHWRLGSS